MDANPGFDGHWVMPEIFLLNGTFTMLEMTAFLLKTFFNSIVKVPFSKNISGMTQCPSIPGFASVKVQNVDFLKKHSVDNAFFSSLTCYHHLGANLGMYIALCIFLNV